MPTFTYKCLKCGAGFKSERKLYQNDADIKCSKCGAPHPERIRKSLLDKFYYTFEGRDSGACASSMG